MDHISVNPVRPFHFAHSLAFINGFAPCAGDHYCQRERLISGGYAGEAPFVVTVWERGGEELEAAIDAG